MNHNDINMWHKRLGHAPEGLIKLCEQKELVEGLNIDDLKNKCSSCQGCQYGKMTQKPYPLNKNRKIYGLFEFLHWDMCGPMETLSIGNNKYLLLIIDDSSNFMFGYFLKNKGESERYI